jgi:hypothetical protein
MPLIRSACLAAALLVSLYASAPAPALAGAADPAGVITSIYAHGHEDAVWTQLLTRGKRDAWVSRDLAALWGQCDALARKSKDEQGALDADILTNSQLGWESFKGFAVSVVSQGGGRAVVDARLQVGPNTVPRKVDFDNVIHYDLVQEGGAWRIDDVSSTVDGKPWSLRQLLKGYLKG